MSNKENNKITQIPANFPELSEKYCQFVDFECWMEYTNRPPGKITQKVNDYGEVEYEYLAIAQVEAQLDQMTAKHWRSSILSIDFPGISDENSVKPRYYCIVTVRVEYYVPATRTWLHHDGVAEGWVYKTKITGGLNVPVLKEIAFKNAAKKIGELFGRSLNREITDNVQFQEKEEEVLSSIAACNSINDLIVTFRNLSRTLQKDEQVIKAFRKRKEALSE